MKKILAASFLTLLMSALTGCGGNETMETFNTEATIEPTVIYDENGVRITADQLTYDNFSAELSVTFENGSDKKLSFISGSAGYHVNSVNGYMLDSGYVNCEVEAGQSATEAISLDFNSLNVYGITEIADMEIGFDISDDEYNSVYTGPVQIKTSAAESYDYSLNTYQEILNNGAFENAFNSTVNYFSDDDLYSNYNICVTSAALMTNSDGEPVLVLEVENNSQSEAVISVNDVSINGNMVYEGMWSSDNINAGKKCLVDLRLTDLADRYEGDISDISNASSISFTFSVGENWYEPADSQTIDISLPETAIPQEQE